MRVNINLKDFRNRDSKGVVIDKEISEEKVEPRRRKIARELKEKAAYLKSQASFISKVKKTYKSIFDKLKDKNKVKDNLKKTPYAYYAMFFATLVIGIIGLALNIKTYKDINTESYDIYTLDDTENNEVLDVNKYEKEVSSISQKEEVKKTIETNSTNVVVSNAKTKVNNTINTKKPVKVVPKAEYVFKYIIPVDGAKVQKIFSMDNVIYSATLDMWKIHEGIDFSGEIGANVIAIEKGKIEKVYTDSLYGVSVILDHGNGYKSIYRNLDENVPIKEGQAIIKGQKIGLIGNTANTENKDDSHLHFELVKGTDIVNPSVIGIF